jgi:superfamily II DNA or RNA helicase
VPLDTLLSSLRPGGRDFERVCKWALENVPEYRQRLRRVWLWDDWTGRWGRDAGIDLVAEDQEGGLWAVQAKHYDPAYSIKKADLDSFLSESSRPEFSFRLLIATTDHLGPTARRTLDAQEKPVAWLLRSQLEALDVAWPNAATPLRPKKPKRNRPRPHHRLAIAECAAGLDASDRGQLIMACGTGKTLVGAFLAERMEVRSVLVLVPSLSLLGQTLREWATAMDFDYLAVCSDETVTKDEQDAVVASTSELGIPVTTNAERIARFLRRRGEATKVIFSTYQSSPQIAAAQVLRVPNFDLVIADEAHRCAGPQAGVFATVLDSTKIKARKRLFMTATPRYFTGRVKREASEADWEVASMDEVAKFGPVLHRLTFGQAIEQELLSEYRVVVVGVTDAEALDLASRGAFVTHDGQAVTDARTLARQIGLLRAMAKHDLRRVVTFHSRIEYATRFASSLPVTSAWLSVRRRPSGDLWADHVSGQMTAGERDARLRRLSAVGSSERGVLTNARCLTEGVDVPTLDGVAFIDPRRSQVDVVQAVGRAIRRAENKSVGTVVIPLFVDEDADPESVLESSEFERVWEVVKALRAHDEVLGEELDELRRALGRGKASITRPGRLRLDLPVGVGDAFARAFDAKLIRCSTSRWDEGLGAASAYREERGHLRVPQLHVTAEGFPLGTWLSTRRGEGNRGVLSAERMAQLDALGMVWDPREEDWLAGLAAATAYAEANGHLVVPVKYTTAEGFPLGRWVRKRRWARTSGHLSLNADRIVQLDALGMAWDGREAWWQEGLATATAYRAANGHLRVPGEFVTANGFRLGSWIVTRRRERSTGKLSPRRIAQLDEIGMVWDVDEDEWQQGVDAAARYLEAEGHLRIPARFVTADGFRLGNWISYKRTARKRGLLTPERIAQLDALGMVWDRHEESWQTGLAAAIRYRAATGHLRVPQKFVSDDSFRLGAWVSARRSDRRGRALSADRIAQLDALGMTWEPFEEGWESGLAAAQAYRADHGDLRVPGDFVSEHRFRLGAWISNRRMDRANGKLDAQRQAELDALDMVWVARGEARARGEHTGRSARPRCG